MRHNPAFAQTDPDVVRTLIAENPWATIVSHADGEIVVSHYPVLLDEAAEDLAILTHVRRPDERNHLFGSGEVLLIVAGPHGYISPSWYADGATPAPTWNFSGAHCYGVPEILDRTRTSASSPAWSTTSSAASSTRCGSTRRSARASPAAPSACACRSPASCAR
jgi:predicted FMN-binding regulatory protein PaiB